MSDNRDRPLPPLSSGSLQPDQSLERLLGAIAKALDGLVEGNFELRQAFGDLRKIVSQHHSRTDSRLTDIQIAVDQFVARVEMVIEHQKVSAGAAFSAKQVLDKSKTALDQAVSDVRKATAMMRVERPEDAEGDAPANVREWSAKAGVAIANFIWPRVIRNGTRAIRVLYVLSSTAFFGFLKIVYEHITQAVH